MHKLLYFLAFFGYLNILCYEVKYCDLFESIPVSANETFLEVVFEDIFDLEHSEQKDVLPEIIFDDYRIFSLLISTIPAIFYFSWLLCRFYLINDKIKHRVYYLRRLILPGYYTFLYRYIPF